MQRNREVGPCTDTKFAFTEYQRVSVLKSGNCFLKIPESRAEEMVHPLKAGLTIKTSKFWILSLQN